MTSFKFCNRWKNALNNINGVVFNLLLLCIIFVAIFFFIGCCAGKKQIVFIGLKIFASYSVLLVAISLIAFILDLTIFLIAFILELTIFFYQRIISLPSRCVDIFTKTNTKQRKIIKNIKL